MGSLGAEGWTWCCALVSAAGAPVPTASGGEREEDAEKGSGGDPSAEGLAVTSLGRPVCAQRTVGPHLLGCCPLVVTPDEWGDGRKMNFLKNLFLPSQ